MLLIFRWHWCSCILRRTDNEGQLASWEFLTHLSCLCCCRTGRATSKRMCAKEAVLPCACGRLVVCVCVGGNDTAQWPRLTGKLAVERGTSWLSLSFFCILCTHPHIPLEWLSRFPNTQAPWLSSCNRHLWEAAPSPQGNTAGGVCLVQWVDFFLREQGLWRLKSHTWNLQCCFFPLLGPPIFLYYLSQGSKKTVV